MQLNLNDRAPKYLQIYEYLHGLIRRNKIEFGDKLPTEMELAERFNVNRMTVRKALDKLVVEDMVVRKRGRGTFLISKTPKEFIYLDFRNCRQVLSWNLPFMMPAMSPLKLAITFIEGINSNLI